MDIPMGFGKENGGAAARDIPTWLPRADDKTKEQNLNIFRSRDCFKRLCPGRLEMSAFCE
jgi:hypothetical protein